MNKSLTVSESIDVNASIEKVWEALTKPAIIKKYLFDTNTETDWKVGSNIVFSGEYQGHTYRDKGVITENIFHKKISYSYWSGFSGLQDLPENYSTVSYTLQKTSDSLTRFTWTQIGYANEEVHAHSQGGMKEFIEQIKNIIEQL